MADTELLRGSPVWFCHDMQRTVPLVPLLWQWDMPTDVRIESAFEGQFRMHLAHSLASVAHRWLVCLLRFLLLRCWAEPPEGLLLRSDAPVWSVADSRLSRLMTLVLMPLGRRQLSWFWVPGPVLARPAARGFCRRIMVPGRRPAFGPWRR